MTDFVGSCLCGSTRFACEGEPLAVGHCYCNDCRKSSGTGHCTHIALSGQSMRTEGEIRFFVKPADSGNVVRRGFCPQCGSALYSTNDAMPGVVFLRASSLDGPAPVTAQMSVYASRAPDWDTPPNGLMQFAIMPEGGPSSVIET